MPVTLIGVTSSNKASNNDSVDEIYEYLQTKFKDIKYFRKQSDKKILVIISKEQSEVTRLKSYLNEHFDLSNVTVHVIEIVKLIIYTMKSILLLMKEKLSELLVIIDQI